jgi:colicin import membrane protein
MNVAVATLQYQEPGKVPSVVLAVAVHVLLAVFLFFGVRWQNKEPEAVMVELWSSPPAPVVEKIVVEPPPPMPEPKPEVKPAPVIEPPKPDIALEKKKETKKEPPKKEVPKKEKEPPKLELDRSKDIRAQLERESAELSKQLEKDRILDQMKREGAASAAKADAAYAARLNAKIKGNVVIPPGILGNPEAIFDVVQLPTGEVMSVKLRKPSGHKAFDEAVERAILKSSPLPKPERPEQFQRSLEIKFKPLDVK